VERCPRRPRPGSQEYFVSDDLNFTSSVQPVKLGRDRPPDLPNDKHLADLGGRPSGSDFVW